uniref:Uncharacterized protein n=1 Tax=viral metagenome TaxID=1070528 RepID=A0A6M3JCN3_9ZZZZ
MIYFVWKDWEGENVEKFNNIHEAKDRMDEIFENCGKYGTGIVLIVEGEEILYSEIPK